MTDTTQHNTTEFHCAGVKNVWSYNSTPSVGVHGVLINNAMDTSS